MEDTGFEGLDEALNTEYKEESKTLQEYKQDAKEIEERKNQFIAKQENMIFEDRTYLRDELKDIIKSAKSVLEKLKKDIKIGTDSKKYEAYAKVLEAIGKQYYSLLDLNRYAFEAYVEAHQIHPTENKKSNKIEMDANQLLDLINKAKEDSQMNEIDAHFDVVDTDEGGNA